jgi:hypothetical protein
VRTDEAFVGQALVNHFGAFSGAEIQDGEDPPDLYLICSGSRIAVEVTRLSQFTIEPDGTLGNRATQDTYGVRLLDELDAQIGPSLAAELSLLIGLRVPVKKPGRFRRELVEWVKHIAAKPVVGPKYERTIEGSKVTISAVRYQPPGKKITGFVMSKNSSRNISLNALMILEDRIRQKHQICEALERPVWLALLNDYWLADADTYRAAYEVLNLDHCFAKIMWVSTDGNVCELTAGA